MIEVAREMGGFKLRQRAVHVFEEAARVTDSGARASDSAHLAAALADGIIRQLNDEQIMAEETEQKKLAFARRLLRRALGSSD